MYRTIVLNIDPTTKKIAKKFWTYEPKIKKIKTQNSVNFKIIATEGNDPSRILTYLPKKSWSRFWSFLLSPVLPGRSSLFLSSV
jgi:hypothetical protein